MKENQIRKQFHDTVRIQTRQYKALEKQMLSTLPKERSREAVRQQRDERNRKIAQLHSQYERTITDMLQQQTVGPQLVCVLTTLDPPTPVIPLDSC